MSKPRVKLENWIDHEVQLGGDVYGHPRFPDGTFVRTSRVVERRDGEVETLNTVYELGRSLKDAFAEAGLEFVGSID